MCSNFISGMILGYPTSNAILGLKDQRSQGHKVQKHIEVCVSYSLLSEVSKLVLFSIVLGGKVVCRRT